MADRSSIEWTDATWSPLRARLLADTVIPTKADPLRVVPAGKWGYHCERISPGCSNCYACTMNGRTLPAWGTGLDYTVPNRAKVEIYLDEKELMKPLHWKRGRRVFVCSTTDLCGEWATDEMIDRMFAVMALCPQHTFQVLTKRAARMREYFTRDPYERITLHGSKMRGLCGTEIPMMNLWLGVSVEDQQRADERIPLLLQTPAAVRFLSVEPLLGPVDLASVKRRLSGESFETFSALDGTDGLNKGRQQPAIDWIIVGGESGPGARPMDIAWARSIVQQCKRAGVPCFVKQLGAAPFEMATFDVKLRDRKGGDMDEWPEDLRIRELPAVAR